MNQIAVRLRFRCVGQISSEIGRGMDGVTHLSLYDHIYMPHAIKSHETVRSQENERTSHGLPSGRPFLHAIVYC